MSKIVLFQAVQFSISTQFSSISPIDRTLSAANRAGQSGTGSDGNEGVLRIPQSSSNTGSSPSDCLVSYQRHSLEESYHSPEIQSVYYASLADWASYWKENRSRIVISWKFNNNLTQENLDMAKKSETLRE